MGKNQDPDPGSYFRELKNNFLGLKILKFFDADPGSGMEKFGSGMFIPDPQHCLKIFGNTNHIKNKQEICNYHKCRNRNIEGYYGVVGSTSCAKLCTLLDA